MMLTRPDDSLTVTAPDGRTDPEPVRIDWDQDQRELCLTWHDEMTCGRTPVGLAPALAAWLTDAAAWAELATLDPVRLSAE